MIIRRVLLRQAARSSISSSSLRARSLLHTTRRLHHPEVESLDASLNGSLQEIRSIEAVLNSAASQHHVQPVESTPDESEIARLRAERIAHDFLEYQSQKKVNSHNGAVISPHYQPHSLVLDPPRPADITLELLLASQSHLGHNTALWNPANARYIFGVRDGIHIISLEVTAAHLRRAAKVVSAVAARAGIILFVGTRPGQDRCVVKAAELSGGCHLFERWTPGTITNGLQILARSEMKVVDELDNEVLGFEEKLQEQAPLKPDLVVCLNPMENWPMLHECALHSIPTIGIIDTDADPTWVTYPIPANDDSLRCVQVIAGVLGRAGEEGRQQRLANAANKRLAVEDRIPYPPAEKLFIETDDGGQANTYRERYTAVKEENMLLLAPSKAEVTARHVLRQKSLDQRRNALRQEGGETSDLTSDELDDTVSGWERPARSRHTRRRPGERRGVETY